MHCARLHVQAVVDIHISSSVLKNNNNNHNNQKQNKTTTTKQQNNDANNNYNNNTIWGGSVLTGEEPPTPLWGVEACSPPTQSQLSRPVSSRHQISMEHRLRRKHLLLNLVTNVRSSKYIGKKRNTFFKKNTKRTNWKMKNENMKK